MSLLQSVKGIFSKPFDSTDFLVPLEQSTRGGVTRTQHDLEEERPTSSEEEHAAYEDSEKGLQVSTNPKPNPFTEEGLRKQVEDDPVISANGTAYDSKSSEDPSIA